jgi:hypothetical protein
LKLRAYAFSGAAGPVREGILPLGELAAVIGANDAGKSRLVQGLASGLQSGPESGFRSAFFIEVLKGESPHLFRAVDTWIAFR